MRAVRSCSVRLLPLAPSPCLCLCLALCLALCPALLPSSASAEPATPDAAGMVLSFTPEAWAESGADAARTPLALKMPLAASQAVLTGPTGKAQLLFEDDSTVSVAPDSRVDIRDFTFTPTQSRFELGLNNGLVRVVSGEIVRRNPGGFAVRTPEAHVGVRGTTFSVARRQGRTTAVLLETSGAGLEVTNLSTGQATRLSQVGYALEVTPGQTLQRPATPAEMNAARQAARQDGAPVALTHTGQPVNLSPQGGKSPAGAADREELLVESVAAAPLQDIDRSAGRASFGASGSTNAGGYWWTAVFDVNLDTAVIEQANLHLTTNSGFSAATFSGATNAAINNSGGFSGVNIPGHGGAQMDHAEMDGQFTSGNGGVLNWEIFGGSYPNTGSGSFGMIDLGPGVNSIGGSFAAGGTTQVAGTSETWNAGFHVSLGTAALDFASLSIGSAFNVAGAPSSGSGGINPDGSFNAALDSVSADSAAFAGQFTSQSGGNLHWKASNGSSTIATGSGAFSKQ